MKWIKLFEDFKNSNEVWPLLGVYSHYDYTGPIKGGDVIKEGFQSLVEKNAFLRAWFDDYGTNKSKYLNNIWRIINWDIVNARLSTIG